mgnify:FL=1
MNIYLTRRNMSVVLRWPNCRTEVTRKKCEQRQLTIEKLKFVEKNCVCVELMIVSRNLFWIRRISRRWNSGSGKVTTLTNILFISQFVLSETSDITLHMQLSMLNCTSMVLATDYIYLSFLFGRIFSFLFFSKIHIFQVIHWLIERLTASKPETSERNADGTGSTMGRKGTYSFQKIHYFFNIVSYRLITIEYRVRIFWINTLMFCRMGRIKRHSNRLVNGSVRVSGRFRRAELAFVV